MKKLLFFVLTILSFTSFPQNQRIRELQTQATNNNNYYIVVDAGGWTRARKMTMQVATSLERDLREYADSLTRAGAGLNTTTGAYIVLTGSNYLTASDFAAIGLTGNINNATFILDSILYDLLNGMGCYSLCIDTIRCSGSSTFVECSIVTDSTISGNRYYSSGSNAAAAIEIIDPGGSGLSLNNTETSDNDLSIFNDVSPYSALSISEDSTGHAIEIIGTNLFNPDTTIHIDFSTSTENNKYIVIDNGSGVSTGLTFNGNGGADYGVVLNLGNGADYGIYGDLGRGNNIGCLFVAGNGNDIGYDFSGGDGYDVGVYFGGGNGDDIGMTIVGGDGADYGMSVDLGEQDDFGVYINAGNGDDVGFYFSGDGGTDFGLDITAETAANLTGDVNIRAGALVQSANIFTSVNDTCPDISESNVILMDYAGSINLEGFASGSVGQVVYLVNKQTGNNVVIKNAAAVVAPAYHIHTGTGGDVTITNEGGATFVFDGTTWYLIGYNQ